MLYICHWIVKPVQWHFTNNTICIVEIRLCQVFLTGLSSMTIQKNLVGFDVVE